MTEQTVPKPAAHPNGRDPAAADTFPVDSFRAAAEHLRRPFTDTAIKFKVQATWPKANPAHGLIVGYIDARLAAERLNLVCPHLWSDEYEPVEGNRLMCILTVDGIARRDIGEGYQGKGLYSDAFKRAAVKFGIGVSLYAIPKIVLRVTDSHLQVKQAGQKKALVLTEAGEKRCREVYSGWLAAHGQAAFGEPLSHGDVHGAIGDPAELDDPAGADDSGGRERDPSKVTKKRATELVDRALEVGVPSGKLAMWLTSQGVEYEEIRTKGTAIEALRQLTPAQADLCDQWLSDELDRSEAS